MIATLQRWLLGLWMLAAALTCLALARGTYGSAPWWALMLLMGTHAAVLALEFAWMRAAHAMDGAPRPTVLAMVQAWASECLRAPLVFFWRQPLRPHRFADHLPSDAAGRRGILLVHGYVCNRGLWNGWLARLRALGVPCLAVNLEPPFGNIDDYRATIADAVAKLTRLTGRPPLVVAHSMGGLAVRAWWSQHRPQDLHHLVTLGTPHHGTRLARLGMTINARQMRERSPWLHDLAARESVAHRLRTTCVQSHCDNIVFPPANALLEGARHVHLHATPHVAMVDHPQAWAIALDWLVKDMPNAAEPPSGKP